MLINILGLICLSDLIKQLYVACEGVVAWFYFFVCEIVIAIMLVNLFEWTARSHAAIEDAF